MKRKEEFPLDKLSMMVGRQLPFFSVIVPFWLVWAMAGWRGMREVWPACLVAGVSFAVTQFLVSNFFGPTLVDIVGAVVSIVCLVLFLLVWKPRTIWLFPGERENAATRSGSGASSGSPDRGIPGVTPVAAMVAADEGDVEVSVGPGGAVSVASASDMTFQRAFIAWMPWLILAIILFLWGLPQIKTILNAISNFNISVPYLDKAVFRAPPVVAKPTAEPAVFAFNWISATGLPFNRVSESAPETHGEASEVLRFSGADSLAARAAFPIAFNSTGLLITGIISGLALGLSPLELVKTFWGTLLRLRYSLLTIAAMLAIGYTTRYAGLDATMGLAFASTGALFPFFSPILGWLGVALTGSDTSSNTLFGSLQRITASRVGVSPILAAASNSSGGVMGKMLDAQSIVVAGVATGQKGGESSILRYVFFHSLALVVLVGILVLLQAYVFPGMIP